MADAEGDVADLRRGRVLVAEDNPQFRAALMRVLGGAGFEVDAVPDGAAALERFDAATKPYDLMVCDIVMPELSGVELVAAVRERSARAPKVIFLTGAVHSALNDSPGRLGEDVMLLKPCGPQELLDAVAEALS